MKAKILFLGMLLMGLNLNAQAPQTMSYQAVVRDAGGTLIVNSAVGVRISILQGSATGSDAYVEEQNVSTNENGLMSLSIGSGTAVTGTMAAIDWSTGPYFIKTETDPAGGTSYTISGTTQMMSVPYALYAETSGSSGTPGGNGPAIGFDASRTSGTISYPSGSDNTIIFNTEVVDQGNNFNPTTSVFTVPSSGLYHVDAFVTLYASPTPTSTTKIKVLVNSISVASCYMNSAGTDARLTGGVSRTIYLTAGQQVSVAMSHTSASSSYSHLNVGRENYFSIHKVL